LWKGISGSLTGFPLGSILLAWGPDSHLFALNLEILVVGITPRRGSDHREHAAVRPVKRVVQVARHDGEICRKREREQENKQKFRS
jgi:hypothetical protein